MICSASRAAAIALSDAGVKVITHVPGYGGNEIIADYESATGKKITISFNEEPALTIAHGAAIAGARSAAVIKTHGLTKGANSILDSLYTDLTAGMVILAGDDPAGSHSDNIFEVDKFLEGISIPFRQAWGHIYQDIQECYELSEELRLPVVLLVNAGGLSYQCEFERKKEAAVPREYQRNVISHVVHPYFAIDQYKRFCEKIYNGVFPGHEESEVPDLDHVLPKQYKRTVNIYRPVFEVFNNYRGKIVTGDTSITSSFALPPYNSIDIVTHLGGSVPLALGVMLAGFQDVWAVTGDFGFLSMGMNGVMEALNRGLNPKILIFNNGSAGATGGQLINNGLLNKALEPFSEYVKEINISYESENLPEFFAEIKESRKLRIGRIITAD